MAKATITLTCSKCGKEFEITVHGFNRTDCDRKVEYYGKDPTGICPECKKEAWVEEQKAKNKAAVENLGYTLPELTGSEKQIKWANDLRARYALATEKSDCYFTEFAYSIFRRAIFNGVTSARQWIEMRGDIDSAFNLTTAAFKYLLKDGDDEVLELFTDAMPDEHKGHEKDLLDTVKEAISKHGTGCELTPIEMLRKSLY